ncbi:MAG: hypothetical protein K5681_09280 [Treponema sp.]|nr:hypothetical protein [Treponema sp.]
MKKIFIAVLCIIPLCLTSCASAPEEELSQEAAPQLETSETEFPETSEEDENTDSEEQNPDNEIPGETETENAETSETEEFPEPADFLEPEVITLEPIEEIEPAENLPESEEVENEEPPQIIVPDENNTAEPETSEAKNAESENLNEAPFAENNNPPAEDKNSTDENSANEIIIQENQSYTDDITGGIDITDDTDSYTENSEAQKEIIPSRSVTLKKFEYLDVTYPGTGWIYMGLTDNSKDLSYFGRKLGTKDTKFSLQAREAGTKIIHFYKNDPLTGQYLDDYIEVTITPENGSNKTHIEAPEYKLPVQKIEKAVEQIQNISEENTEEKNTGTNSTEKTSAITTNSSISTTSSNSSTSSASKESTGTSVNQKAAEKTAEKTADKSAEKTITQTELKQTTANTEESKSTAKTESKTITNSESSTVNTTGTSSEKAETNTTEVDESKAFSVNSLSLLQEAQVLYNEKEYSAALKKLNQFFEFSTDNRDEALYLKGQILEAKSDVRDIKDAIDAYTTLTKNYPASRLWDSANKRIIYLKRFYLEVR